MMRNRTIRNIAFLFAIGWGGTAQFATAQTVPGGDFDRPTFIDLEIQEAVSIACDERLDFGVLAIAPTRASAATITLAPVSGAESKTTEGSISGGSPIACVISGAPGDNHVQVAANGVVFEGPDTPISPTFSGDVFFSGSSAGDSNVIIQLTHSGSAFDGTSSSNFVLQGDGTGTVFIGGEVTVPAELGANDIGVLEGFVGLAIDIFETTASN
ncbi:hypothetical protein [Pseudohaliea rubra]|uniref:hypothetical protein n=1 Tax=Pseudohaliea rubra TaxID=475795 RepID=UPI0005583AD3|nr:hypothetical protein [Pseudohaliea rubra]